MTPVDVLRNAGKRTLVGEDGEPMTFQFQSPMSEAEIAKFEQTIPCPLPATIRELLLYCRGFEGGATDFVDFTGARCDFAHEEVFPNGLPFAADGCGNFWVVDLTPESEAWGPIYFACHDAPVILYQSPGLEHFLTELLKASEPPHKSGQRLDSAFCGGDMVPAR
jgi:cell wall assembly regulator SMI1